MTWGRALRFAVVWSASGIACQTPERVYFEVPLGSGGTSGAASGVSGTGGAAVTAGSGAETGGATPITGGAAAETGGTSGSSAGGTSVNGGAPALGGAQSTGGASTASAAISPEQQFDTCAEYMLAQCRRLDDCSVLHYEQCLGIAIPQCPQFFFASSAHATLDAIQSCTEKWRRATCDDIETSEFPGCAFAPGDRKLGEACSFNTQCETGRCDRSQSWCGSCVALVGEGQECGPEVASCGAGLACKTTCVPGGGPCSEVCAPSAPVNVAPLGAACSDACETGSICDFSAGSPGICQPLRKMGQPCASTPECLEGYCDTATRLCAPSPVAGMPCALDARYLGRDCAGSSVCDHSFDVPLCVNPVPLGEPCTADAEGPDYYNSNCQTGLACACTDRTCSSGARQCSRILPPGADCDFAGAWCAEPTECKEGRCELVLRPDPNVESCRP